MKKMEKVMITTKEAAEICGCSAKTISKQFNIVRSEVYKGKEEMIVRGMIPVWAFNQYILKNRY
ncbi:MAG: hypothetical protein EOM50_02965 [Erysipelotrichia bacterium]|nr:hypothetical protein [Erysipelotrichia bacterium]NCC54113.1 hypothetical protein [Erysipelotrichia bacterium]